MGVYVLQNGWCNTLAAASDQSRHSRNSPTAILCIVLVIEIMKVSTIVWENISKADQAMILHGVRLYLVSVIVWEIANLWKFVEELLKVIKIQNFCFYYLLIIPRCLINPLFNP